MNPDERPAIEGPSGGADDLDPDLDFDDLGGGLADRFAAWGADRPHFIYAPHGNINAGSVHGDQRVENGGVGTAPGTGERVEAQDGPISGLEVLAARTGFAEPDCFPEALRTLGTRLLFLAGDPGTGRRTTALNLLFERSGHSVTALRALDSDSDLSSWRPTNSEARGYLVHGLSPTVRLGPAAIAKLRQRLDDAKAFMVVMLPYDADRLRGVARDLELSPVRYTPPSPRAVFAARLEAVVPAPERRRALLDRLEPDLDELLAPELMPSQVAELVDEVSRSGDDGPDPADLGQRLSFLAETEVPDLLKELREDPDALAFLLVTSVLEGLDHRIVRDETDRLLKLADGRLNAVLRAGTDGQTQVVPGEAPQPNPRFVFRRSLDELLATVRAECSPGGTRRTSGYAYTVEPIRFKRHRQAETVLRHVWRQYGEVSGLLTEWINEVPASESDLAEPMGRVVGLATGWSGGRQALTHIRELARSEHPRSRSIAAYALGIAARDPILVGEVKYRLTSWSLSGWRLRSTAAGACGGDFGAARPEFALSLLRRCYRGQDGDEREVASAVRWSLRSLFAGGNQTAVFRELLEWADQPGPDAELALTVLPDLLEDPFWFLGQLGPDGELGEGVVTIIRRALNERDLFAGTSRRLLGWCQQAVWDEPLRVPVEALLIALSQEMHPGEFGLLAEIDGSDDPDLVGRDIAHRALEAWRHGEPQPYRTDPLSGGPDDRRH
ncbi:hypothetical protein [Streptomyces sp. CBMA156]|uniref:hypothetical protein n=1 Tax=Streptomyces sp. CBMA156 TaxID=1930280 RepID=UPI001661C49F|nr:hypothetical protein [Streptomyces sp. CBMA156]